MRTTRVALLLLSLMFVILVPAQALADGSVMRRTVPPAMSSVAVPGALSDSAFPAPARGVDALSPRGLASTSQIPMENLSLIHI